MTKLTTKKRTALPIPSQRKTTQPTALQLPRRLLGQPLHKVGPMKRGTTQPLLRRTPPVQLTRVARRRLLMDDGYVAVESWHRHLRTVLFCVCVFAPPSC